MDLLRLTPPSQSERKRQLILGRPVCQHAFKRLLGLGAMRFAKLKKAVATNQRAPVDLRQRPRRDDGSHRESIRKRGLIAEFLEEILHTMAEPMPEVGKKRKGLEDAVLPDMKFRRAHGKVPSKQKRALGLKVVSSSSKPALEALPGQAPPVAMKLLPPGTFTDYLRLLQDKRTCERFSLKLFLKVAWFFFRSQ